ncbi:MAG: class I tRNA ligase family protein [Patescibacteria group bacterium]
MEEKKDNKEKSEIAKREEKILEFWKENNIFEKSLEQSKDKKEFVFYEGPPTANGKPGIHHLEARAFKDVIPRYKTMNGFYVRRKGGWDTHGLPVELQVEKMLGLNSKKAIEEYGIAKFNEQCKKNVWEYLDFWEKFTERIGYWVDQKNPYITYRNSYIESVWNIVKKIDDQKLFYKDYKVVPWCPRCGTGLSSHELAQGYEDVKDLSVYVKFEIKNQDNNYILAWTTTPWTLPGNVALAIGFDIEYVKVKLGNEFLILAKARLSQLLEGNNYKIVEEMKGKDLIGLEYEPLFSYLINTIVGDEKIKLKNAYKIYNADFVNTEDGTGVVHTAVMYGQDDFELGTKVDLPKHHLVNPEGNFIKGTGFLEGRFVKEIDEKGKPTMAVDIIEDLKKRNLFFKQENYKHSYPHCWRCHTSLVYYARDSWYIRMSDPKIKKTLIEENSDINWEPEYIRDGRFGEWLREIKDWAISRERYWGTPLPIWECSKCEKRHVVGSLEELKNKTKKSGNKYFVMRHGEAENNIKGGVHYKDLNLNAKLTELGKKQVLESSKNFKEKIDIVFSSPFERAKETAKIFCDQINFPLKKIIYDKRIQEWETSSFFEGKNKTVFNKYYDKDYLDNPNEILPDGESFVQLIKRIGQFIYELEANHSNKNILIFGHGSATDALSFVIRGLLLDSLSSKNNPFNSLKNAEIKKFNFIPLSHNENFELDLHKPYIDEVKLMCDCGSDFIRTKEVMDVWFDSGAMPFAQDHYPFDYAQGKPLENQKLAYPADFISEAIDQTRGWFYTLHAIGVLMGRGKAYKNVICLGHLLDANGKKMSKSLGNVIDPWIMIEKYGVDTLRLWMYSVNQPGESKNFDEKTVQILYQQVFGLLYNVLAFYELYRNKDLEKEDLTLRPLLTGEGWERLNILDQWILARLDELVELTTKNLDNYKLLEPTRAIRDFIGDLSTWYLRRSRERIKEGDKEAKQVLYFVLKTLSKIMAPFAPFGAEDIYLKLKNEKDPESVHLTKWPNNQLRITNYELEILKNMEIVRKIVTLGLEARQRANIKVRQPLFKLEIKNYELGIEYADLIKEELNVKEVIENKNIDTEILLDIEITKELKEEGDFREFIRGVQDIRKQIGLTPNDMVSLIIETDDKGVDLINKFEKDLLKTVSANNISFEKNNGIEIKIEKLIFKIKIEK